MSESEGKKDSASDNVMSPPDNLEHDVKKEKMTKAEILRFVILQINKRFWILFFFLTYLFFFLHSGFLLDQLFQDRIGYENKPNSIKFEQPEILICPYPFYVLNNKPDPKLIESLREIENMTEKYKLKPHMTKLLVWDSLDIKTVKDKLFHKENQLFLDINCGNFIPPRYKLELNPVHFLCYRFPKKTCKLSNKVHMVGRLYIDSFREENEFEKILETNKDDYSSVRVNSNTLDDIFTSSDLDHESNALVYMYFVKSKHSIDGTETHFSMNGNIGANIYVQVTKYENQYRKKFPCAHEKYRYFYNLLETNITKNLLSFTYESSCVNYQLQMYFYKTYNCVLMILPIPYPEIPQPFNSCFNISTVSTRSKNMSMMYSNFGNAERVAKKKCTLVRNCVEYKYNINVDKLNWPETGVLNTMVFRRHKHGTDPSFTRMYDSMQLNPSTINKWKRNFFKFKIRAGEHNSSSIKEYFSYTGLNFFSDIGGILGFYLGASILTMKEFGLSLFYSLKKYLIDSKKKRRERKEQAEEVV